MAAVAPAGGAGGLTTSVHPGGMTPTAVPVPRRVSMSRFGVTATTPRPEVVGTGPVIGGCWRVPHGAATTNQLERKPAALRNVSPLTVTCPFVPRTWTDTTRPPHSPNPLRAVTATSVNVPIVGKAASIWLTG